jgi:Flp pilus assembly pilin Flp
MREQLMRMYVQAVARAGALPEREEGQGLVEYALILLVAVLIVMGAVKGFGNTLAGLFTRLIGQVAGIGN